MKNQITSGTILISKPFMEDKRFEKTIILIVEHNLSGTIGFIINKKKPVLINDLIPNISTLNLQVHQGGPVEKDSIFFIHKHPDLIHNSTKIKDGLFWGGDINDMIYRVNNKEIKTNEIIFLLGYAGWENNQLQNEINEGSWIIHNIQLTNFNNLKWSDLLIEVNKDYEVWATAPTDFHLN